MSTDAMRVNWWDSDTGSDERETRLFAHIDWLVKQNADRRESYSRFLAVYNGWLTGKAATAYFADPSARMMVINDTRAVIETLVSKIGKQKPRPLFITDMGSWEKQSKAKKLSKFIEGRFYTENVYELMPLVLGDAGIFGTGIVKAFVEESTVRYERVMPGEILVGKADGAYGNPRIMVQGTPYDRGKLMADFPEHEVALSQATDADNANYKLDMDDDDEADKLIVWEVWRLPTSKKAKDGRHIIAVRGLVLLDEAWDLDEFPFVFIRWTDRPYDFWGQGIVETVLPAQVELNKVSSELSKAHHFLNKAKILVPKGSGVPKSHIENDIVVWEYEPTVGPPQVVAWNVAAPDVYQYQQFLRRTIYELSGQTQLGATGQKPAGLNSGAALREYSDIETERFGDVARKYEQAFIHLARKTVKLQKAAKNSRVKFDTGWAIEVIDFKEVSMPEEDYVLKCYPVSSLPQHPAGRMAMVEQLMQGGIITDPKQARSLLGFPDLEKADALATSTMDLVDSILEKIIEEGEFIGPEPSFDLQYCQQMAQAYYCWSKLHGAPEDRLELLRQWELGVVDLIARAAPPPQPVPPQMPAAPVNEGMPA